jgi:hypothetical protein
MSRTLACSRVHRARSPLVTCTVSGLLTWAMFD